MGAEGIKHGVKLMVSGPTWLGQSIKNFVLTHLCCCFFKSWAFLSSFMLQQQPSGTESTGSLAENTPGQLEIPNVIQTVPLWPPCSLSA